MNAGRAVLDGGGVPRGAPQALPMQPAPIMCSEAPLVLTCSLGVKTTVLYCTRAYRALRQMDPSPAGSSSAERILCPSTALSAGEMTVAQADSHSCPSGACLSP